MATALVTIQNPLSVRAENQNKTSVAQFNTTEAKIRLSRNPVALEVSVATHKEHLENIDTSPRELRSIKSQIRELGATLRGISETMETNQARLEKRQQDEGMKSTVEFAFLLFLVFQVNRNLRQVLQQR